MKPVIIFCKLCDKETKHGDVGILPVVKCFMCGEYNTLMTEEKKTVVDEIMEPAEKVWKAMVDLANSTQGHGEGERERKRGESLYTLAQEMDAALSFIHRNIEGLLVDPDFDGVEYVVDAIISIPEERDGRGTQ